MTILNRVTEMAFEQRSERSETGKEHVRSRDSGWREGQVARSILEAAKRLRGQGEESRSGKAREAIW